MRKQLLALFCLGLASRAAAAGLDVQVHHFVWSERDPDGQTLLEESGPLIGLRVDSERALSKELSWRYRGECFLGEVDYDGATTLGDPLRTTTAYYGLKAETDLGWDVMNAPGLRTGPLGGLSTRAWLRRLDNSERSSTGYDEAWLMLYARTGWFAAWPLNPGAELVLDGGLRLPLVNVARYSLTGPDGEGDVSVEPGRELSYEASLEFRSERWRIGLAYEDFAFGRSDAETLPPYEVFQPESKGRIVSASVGLLF